MKTGRPKLASHDKKDQITGVRLRGNEREMLEKAAAWKKQTLSHWIRETLILSATRQNRAASYLITKRQQDITS
jgi:uncharacterized protein (DUF1778 family)